MKQRVRRRDGRYERLDATRRGSGSTNVRQSEIASQRPALSCCSPMVWRRISSADALAASLLCPRFDVVDARSPEPGSSKLAAVQGTPFPPTAGGHPPKTRHPVVQAGTF